MIYNHTNKYNNMFKSKYLHFLGEKSVAGSKDNNKNLNCFECVSQEAIFFVQNRSNKAIIMCDKDTITKQVNQATLILRLHVVPYFS